MTRSALSSRSRLSHAVARMEEAGWVERHACPTDRRGAYAHLTDAGLARLAEAAPGHVEAVRTHLFDQLTVEQQHALREISEKLLAHLGGPRVPMPPASDGSPGSDGATD